MRHLKSFWASSGVSAHAFQNSGVGPSGANCWSAIPSLQFILVLRRVFNAAQEFFPLTSVLLTSNYYSSFLSRSPCDCCTCDTFLHLQMYDLPQIRKNLSRIAYLLKILRKKDCFDACPAAPVVFTLSMNEKI